MPEKEKLRIDKYHPPSPRGLNMRSLYFLFILLVITFTCHAQDTVKRSIPLLKESSKIDSLISSVINFPANLTALKKDSCILLGLFKSKNDAGFIQGVHTLNHGQIIFDLTNFAIKKNCGYFEYNGYLIFVYGDSFMKEFFNDMNSKKEFIFIKPATKEVVLEMRYLMGWAVFYKNGVFNWGVH